MSEIFKVMLMGLVQGITEWLPISSTGHMILLNEFIHLNVSIMFWEMFLVVIQLGSILAVLYLYFDKLNPFSKNKTNLQRYKTRHLWIKVLIGSLPAAVIGFLLDDKIHLHFYNPLTISLMLFIYGVLFIAVEKVGKAPVIKDVDAITYQTALIIGGFQALALLPGTSRSGATIIGAILLGASRCAAAEFSFFLAIPVMFGASGYKILKYACHEGLFFTPHETIILVVGVMTAFLVSVAAIKFLMDYIRRHDFKAFGYYRIILAIIVAMYFLSAANLK